MAKASEPSAVKLICGMISSTAGLFDEALAQLAETFGPADVVSEVFPFDLTHYYDDEMGSPLWRRFVSFRQLVAPDVLVEAKLLTNALEDRFAARASCSRARPINLDPGYVEQAKLVLASMKNFSHRIHLGRGVYGEVTLLYHKDRWQALQWTFPDFASPRYWAFLDAARDSLRAQSGREKSS